MPKIKLIKTIFTIIGGFVVLIILLLLKASSLTFFNPYYAALTLFIFFYLSTRITASFLYKPYYHDEEENYLPSVSFIIPTYNEEGVISQTIGHCFNADYPEDRLEVIVINDGSTDNTWEEILKTKKIFPELTTINFRDNEGKREAMAAGMRRGKGEIIVQLDSDSHLERGSLKNLVSGFKDKDMAGISAHTDPQNGSYNLLTKIQSAYYYVAFRVFKAAESTIGLVLCCSGCCSAFRREYLLPVIDQWRNEAHFGHTMRYGEDRSLTNMLIKNGYRTAYCSSAQAYTIVPTKFSIFLRQQLRWKKSWIITTHRTARYILKRDAFVGLVYLFPQIIVNYAAPLLAAWAILFAPLFSHVPPTGYLVGLLLLYTIYVAYYVYLRSGDKYGWYIVVWGLLSIFLAVVLFPTALFKLPDNRWLTR